MYHSLIFNIVMHNPMWVHDSLSSCEIKLNQYVIYLLTTGLQELYLVDFNRFIDYRTVGAVVLGTLF